VTLRQVTLRRGWVSRSGSHACGSAFRDDELLGSDALCAYLVAPPDFEAFVAKIEKLNGFFAAIVEAGPETVYAAVDPLRSIPLFYASNATRQHGCLFSDDASWLDEWLGPERAPAETATEFLLAGYVTGADTLHPAIKQLQAGEALKTHVGADGRLFIDHRQYFKFVPRERIRDKSALHEQLDWEMKTAVGRLIRFAGGRQIVVPLSGGNDSRDILLTLRRLGYDKLLAFTYGRPGNRESVISERVAARLGVIWRFVPYDNTMWAAWWRSDGRKRYFALSHQLVSLPHFQDHPAVGVLQREGAIEDSAVFAPGLGGFVVGSDIPRRFVNAGRIGRDAFLNVMHEVSYRLWDWREQPREHIAAIHAKLLHQLGQGIDDPHHAIAAYEKWELEERQAKFIVNAVRVYGDFGHDWWLPFLIGSIWSSGSKYHRACA
jgi:asparagine synthase (glutamine-hydrolysing)